MTATEPVIFQPTTTTMSKHRLLLVALAVFADRCVQLATACNLLILVFVIAAPDARAQHYANRQIRMIIPSGPGNAYDAYARALSRHLARHIPGMPTIVNQNMPGASGMTATNWAYNVAPKDGSVIVGVTNVVLAEPLYENPSARFEPLKFGLIGSVAKQQNVCVTWRSRPVKTIKDAMTNEVTVSASGAATNAAVLPKIFNALLRTKFKVITGYTTNAERLAVERGEVDGICGLSWTTIKATSSSWVSNNLINVLIQTGAKPQSGLENVPVFADLVADTTNKKIVELLGFPEEMGRPFVMPPGTPRELLNEIRRAFDVTMRDPQFRADIEKSLLDIDPVAGEAMEQIIKRTYATPKDLVKQASQLRSAAQ